MLLLSVLVVVTWFPITAYLTERMESLEITFGFLQTLGLLSSYSIKYPEPLGSFFSGLAFFNLDVDMMRLGECTNSFWPLVS